MQNGDEACRTSFGGSRSFSENAHSSVTAPYIWIKFSILIHFNIVETLVYKMSRISPVGRGQMLITLEPHGILRSNFLIFTD